PTPGPGRRRAPYLMFVVMVAPEGVPSSSGFQRMSPSRYTLLNASAQPPEMPPGVSSGPNHEVRCPPPDTTINIFGVVSGIALYAGRALLVQDAVESEVPQI